MPSFWDLVGGSDASLHKLQEEQQQQRDQRDSVNGRGPVETGHSTGFMRGLGAGIPAEPDFPVENPNLPQNAKPQQYQAPQPSFGALGNPAALTKTQPFNPVDAIPSAAWRNLLSTPEGRQRALAAAGSWPQRVWEGAVHAVTGPGRAWKGEMDMNSDDPIRTALTLTAMLGGMDPEIALGHATMSHSLRRIIERYGGKMEKLEPLDNMNDAAEPLEEAGHAAHDAHPPVPFKSAEGYGKDWL